MKKLINIFSILVLAAGFIAVNPIMANAAKAESQIIKGANDSVGGVNKDGSNDAGLPSNLDGDGGIFLTVTNVMLYIIGGISVIMLIYGGIRYTTSGGNSTYVTAAKNTIMYSIIGLVIAILAYAIVNFIIDVII